MLKRKAILVPLCIALIIAFGSACGGEKDAGDESGKQSTLPASSQESEKIEPTEVYFFSTGDEWWNESDFMKYYGEPLQKKYPYMFPKTISISKMNLDQMDSLITSNQPIDVILAANSSFLTYVAPYDLQTNIEPLIKRQNIDLGRFRPEIIEMNKKMGGGSLIGLPMGDYPTQILYNKAIFDKFGVAYPPKDRWTWDDMYATAKKLTRADGGTQYYGVRIHATYFRRNPFSLTFVDPQTNRAAFNNDTGKKVTELYLRQYEGSDTKGLGIGVDAFFKDKVLAMWMPLGALYPAADNYVGMDWDLAPVPYLPEQGNVSVQPYPLYLYVSKISKHQDLAMQAIDYFTSESFQTQITREGMFVTALNNRQIADAFGQDSPLFAGKNVSAMSPEKFAPPASYDRFNQQASAVILPNAANQVRDGKIDINTALRQAEEEVNQYIDAQRTQANK